jgi:hypothetical protein
VKSTLFGSKELTDIGHGVGYRIWVIEDGMTPGGLVYEHPDPRDPEKRCGGCITFKGFANVPDAEWDVESFEPLTISPSLACQLCGHHGFVRGGKWVPA